MIDRQNFSGLLQQIMERKKVSRRELANGTGLGEIVYKYVRGTRKIPELETVDKLADYMQCTPAEKKLLRQAWRMDTYGPRRLERWKQLAEFLARSHYSLDRENVTDYSFYTDIRKDAKPYLFLHNELEVQQAILAVMDDCSRNKKSDSQLTSLQDGEDPEQYIANGLLRIQNKYQQENGICAVMQSGAKNIIQLFHFAEQRTKHLHISHVFALPIEDTEDQNDSHASERDTSLISLQYLQAVIPLTLESPNYESRYYYSRQSFFQLWPLGGSFILSDRYAVIFGNNREGEKNGLFSSDPELIRFLKKTFHQIYRESRPFLTHADNYTELLNSYYDSALMENKSTWYLYCEQPCLCPYLTPAMVKKYATGNVPDELIQKFLEHIRWYRNTQLKLVKEYSRLSGLNRFLQTGRIDEIPQELYESLSVRDRLFVLDSWLIKQKENPTRFLRWNEEESNRLSAHFFPEKAFNISFYADERFCTFSTEEGNLLDSFNDYFTHIEENQLYTEQEVNFAIERMKEKIITRQK